MLCSNDSERKMAEWKKITVSDIADTHKDDMSTVFLRHTQDLYPERIL